MFRLPSVDLLSLDIPRPGAGLRGDGEAPVGRTVTAREGALVCPRFPSCLSILNLGAHRRLRGKVAMEM